MRIVLRYSCFLLLTLSLGCSRKEGSATDRPTATTTTPAASSSVSPSSSSSSSSAFSSSSAVTADTPKTAAEIAKDATPPLESSIEQPAARLKTKQGSMVVWSTPEGEANSLVLAAYEKEKKPGELVAPGAAKILRKTSGQVQALAAVVMDNDDIAVAWTSGLLEGKGQLNAVVFTSPDLTKVTPPTTLGIINAPIQLQAHVGLIKRPAAAGGGVVAAHQGPGTSCKLLEHPTECVTFDVKAVGTDGKVEKLGSTKLHGGPSPEYFFVDLKERGLLVYGSSMRGGRTLASVVAPWSAKDPAPPFESPPECGGQAGIAPDFVKGVKDEVVTLCIDVPPEKGPACAKPITGEKDRCVHIAASSGEGGKSITGKGKWDVPVTKVECVDGKPKLTFPGGDVTLTSSTPNLGDFVKKCGSGQ